MDEILKDIINIDFTCMMIFLVIATVLAVAENMQAKIM